MSSKRKIGEAVLPSTDRDQAQAPDGSGPGSGESRGRTAVKRQRVSRACDQCRAAREKCDGIQPLCFPCVSQNRPCTYQANPKKRGVQTGYIRTLELALGWVFDKVPGSEDALSSLLSHEGGQGQRLLTGSDSSVANRLHQKWRRSRVHRDIDRILSGGESIGLRHDKSPSIDDATDTDGEADRLSGPSHGQDGSSRALHQNSAWESTYYQPSSSEKQCPTSAETASERAVTASLGQRTGATAGAPLSVKLPPNHWRLMDIYFSYTHCWLPILEKQEMFQASYLYSSGQPLDLSPETPSSSTHAELWSALALASCQDVASSTAAKAAAQIAGPGLMTPTQIYHIARSLLPADDGIFHIHHTRALILLSLVNLGRRNLTSAWLLIGKAVRIFLDVSSGHASGHDKDQQRLRSVFIACFIMDTMISQQSCKPPHLTAEDMVEAMNISENDLDEWQPWAACEGFGHSTDNSRVSRNPAYCLSTFNQLYDIFKVVGRRIARSRARAEHDTASAVGLSQLQQAINIQAPFGRYILSSGADSAPVPSPYLLKIFYLWAAGLVDTISSSTARLMVAVIEQYQTRFGSCAMPPFLAACLASWSSHAGFEGLERQDQMRLSALRDRHTAIWDPKPAASSPTDHDREPPNTSFAYKGATEAEHRANTMLSLVGSTVHDSSYADSYFPGRSSSPGQGRHSLSVSGSSYIFPSYGNPRGVVSPAVAVLPGDAARGAMSDVENAIAAQTAAALQPPYDTVARLNVGTNPADYDALLDDLASIDYADRVETDPQFMVNLGFAPGCDLNEVLSLDFAGF
ncbi:Quinic acid utilization activator [Coniochaeta hoffmannii]|uniref:Quinic acid utilization activator n=1 Tax=Coniochaeta hoffmannii TaxID=91930 RepID=A0AA38VLL6_9PEZI|nr:Quinic acid utilization activator [Coniochaeta hoffmannii]